MRKTTVVSLLFLLLSPGPCAFAQQSPGKAPLPYPFVGSSVEGGGQDERFIEDRELKPVAAQPCGSESNLKSLNGDTRTFLRFKNKTLSLPENGMIFQTGLAEGHSPIFYANQGLK